MPVHISVPLGSTESEIRLGGSQPGNGLRFSSFFFFSQPRGRVSGHKVALHDVLLAAKRMKELGFIFM